jgi:Holliday junction resolvasome RuvABC endonuclease subunit
LILGLDISTSCTGWCLIDPSENNIIEMGYIDLSKEKNFLLKAEMVKDDLVSLYRKNMINRVFIEENLQAFRPGFSSAKTLMTLARFNGIISYICKRDLGLDPEFINVNIARKTLGFKINRSSSFTTKEQIFEWVDSNVDFNWPTKVLKSGPRKGIEILTPGCYDMADAYVIARAGIEIFINI